jgi:Flp pilus assembly protein TadG
MRNDRGGVIVGYFTKIALVLVVFSVLCFDVVSVGVARVGVEDTARSAAMAAAETYNTSRDADYALRIASEYAEEHGTTVTDFSIADDGTVTVRVEKEATTLLLYRTKKTSQWAQVSASGSGRAV